MRARRLLAWVLVALWASGCASSPPDPGPAIDARSSLLGVDVRFPVALGRDPSLVRAYLVKGPIHGGLDRLPELVPASFVKGTRAYWVDPEPGTWSLVAVTHAYSPPHNRNAVMGVSDTVADGGDIGNAVILPSDWIERTRTTVAPGRVAFMGVLSVEEGERVRADTRFEDVVQERLAEAVRPGATSRSGLAGRFSRTWTLDRERSSFRRGEGGRDDFLRGAKLDLAGSPWAGLVPRPRPSDEELASRWTKSVSPPVAPEGLPSAPEPEVVAPPQPEVVVPAREREVVAVPPQPEAVAVPPQPEVVAPAPAVAPEPVAPAREREVVAPPQPEVVPSAPEPEVVAVPPPEAEVVAVPAGPEPIPIERESARATGRPGALGHIVPGMSHDDVRAILGDPDERRTYMTTRALIPFYSGPDVQRRVWIYRGRARVEFSLNSRTGTLRVVRVEGPEAVSE